MYNMSMFIVKLRNLRSLSKTNKRIAQYFEENLSEGRYLTSSAIAAQLNISQSSISRFATEVMGYGSFREMQLDIENPNDYGIDEIIEKDNGGIIKQKILRQTKDIIELTDSLNDIEIFEKIVDKTIHAHNIICYGMGNSGLFAEYLSNRLIRLGLDSFYSTNSHTVRTNAIKLSNQDLIFILSESGTTEEIIKLAKIAQIKNVPLVSITGDVNSELAMLSDYVLCSFDKTYNYGIDYISMRAAQLHIIDVIFFLIISKEVDKYKQCLYNSRLL